VWKYVFTIARLWRFRVNWDIEVLIFILIFCSFCSFKLCYCLIFHQGRREGGRAGNFYRGPRLNGGPEELYYGARNRQSMKEPYNFYRGPSILSTALFFTQLFTLRENFLKNPWNFQQRQEYHKNYIYDYTL
jgi:hypothetical protein